MSESMGNGVQETIELLRAKILHQLEIFPFLSRSMIHMSIGTATPTQLWGPILDSLVEEGAVKVTELSCRTPGDRQQAYTIYHLATNHYRYGPSGTSDASPHPFAVA